MLLICSTRKVMSFYSLFVNWLLALTSSLKLNKLCSRSSTFAVRVFVMVVKLLVVVSLGLFSSSILHVRISCFSKALLSLFLNSLNTSVKIKNNVFTLRLLGHRRLWKSLTFSVMNMRRLNLVPLSLINHVLIFWFTMIVTFITFSIALSPCKI